MPKVVISGGPCSGKTTLVRELERIGYSVTTETAEEVYTEKGVEDHSRLSPSDWLKIQLEIEERQIRKESALTPDKLVFMDRSAVDSLAYHRRHGFKLEPRHVNFVRSNRYDAVFFLEMTKPYVIKGVRVEDEETARSLGKNVYNAYLSFGYRPMILPSVPTNGLGNRVEIILKYLTDMNFK